MATATTVNVTPSVDGVHPLRSILSSLGCRLVYVQILTFRSTTKKWTAGYRCQLFASANAYIFEVSECNTASCSFLNRYIASCQIVSTQNILFSRRPVRPIKPADSRQQPPLTRVISIANFFCNIFVILYT